MSHPPTSVHGLFAARVAEAPHATALIAGERRMTYRELDAATETLARRLRELAVGPGALVGVALERSAGLYVGLLAILKAGAAYLPLDPAYPAERLAFMLRDARVAVVLADAHAGRWLPPDGVAVVHPDAAPAPDAPAADLACPAGGDDPAYVIYTSGSTGTPKGVLVPHRALANHNAAIGDCYGLCPADRVLQFASASFDVAAEEIFPTWAAGATVVAAPEEALRSVAALLAFVEREGVTVLNLPTPYWHEWVNQLERGAATVPGSVRLVVVGSDTARPDRLAAWQRLVGDRVRWLNAYGPTETTITTTVYEPVGAFDPLARTVPIGRTIANATVRLLDETLAPVSPGEPGELYIGGAGLALGYLGRPELTAERFVADPFGAPGERLYRTGDLARLRPDGDIEFLGRIDQQVKIRGFRIELGEIEAALGGHPAVAAVAVAAREATPGDRRLVAYVVATDAAPPPDELRRFLRERLPEYMVPALFVALDALPLMPNGKVDRRALPEPDLAALSPATYVAPATPTERALAAVWEGVLGRAGIGAEDNFFDLGGHSLQAVQILSRVAEQFGVALPALALFERPTIAALALAIEAAPAGAAPRSPIAPLGRDRALPLSFAQQRLWFFDRLVPGSPLYTIPLIFALDGALDAAALEASLAALIRRHEALRTIFSEQGDGPAQVIAPPGPFALGQADLCAYPADERAAVAARLLDEAARRPFDLGRGPLLRALLLRLGEREHRLLLAVHHIAFDGWSADLFTRELAALYRAATTGADAALPAQAIGYADFAAWQREALRGEALERLMTYWRAQFPAAPPLLALPTDRPRPTEQTYRGAKLVRPCPPELLDALERLSRREGATLFMTLLAAFQTLLHRHTGLDDIVVGSPIANRTRAEVEGLIGFFVNTLALRTRFDGDPTFRELLGRVRAASLGAYAHQDLPFERLVEELQPQRDPSYNPLFQVVFALQNTPEEELRLPGLTLQGMDVDAGTAQLDLSLYIWETPEGLVCRLEYNTDLFEEATILRLLGHYETLLGGIVADPGREVAALPLLTRAERRAMLLDWNETSAPIPDGCVHDLFAAQVARTPDKVAVRHGDHALTFRELDRRSSQLAHHLRSLGVGPETLVGLCVERGTETIVALLGIIKAGGAYLPLDPGLPRERLAFMLDDSRAALLLTQRVLLDRLPERGGPVVCLDTDWPTIARWPETAPASGATPDTMLYVIYTSGSTGRPKGVQIVHRGMVNLVASMRREPGLTERDAMLAMTTLSFDMAGPELYLPLTTGAEMVIIGRDVAADGPRLIETIASSGVTVVQATPATWRLLLEAGWPGDRRLTILCGGEALTRDLARQLLDRCGALWNMYGPTETTVWSTCCRITGNEPEGAMPVGRPLANTQLYLVDARGQSVPVGVTGELFIGGAGLARGYLDRPELTAERYVENLFARVAPHRESARLYRTGDLARYRADGTLEFLGRIDHQVKIRGFRIELGEIESVLGQHPDVAATVVLAREDTPGDQRLVAYLVPEAGRAPDGQALRAHLKAALPDYMVPALFVALESFPLTPNGKVDRKALPAPERGQSGAGTSGAPPTNAEEARIAAIWSAVLGLDGIGIDDNFFDLGGESFKAIRAIRQIGAPASVMDIFKHPTVRRLAAHLAQGQPRDVGLLHELTPPIPVAQRKLSLVCVPYAGGNAIAFQPLANALPPGHALYALQLPGHDFARPGEELLPLEEIARRCAEEIRRDLAGPVALYGHCVGGALTTAIARRLEEDGAEVAGVFVGGHFPTPRLPGKLFEWHARIFSGDRWTSKQSVLEFLHTSGFFTDVLDPAEQDFIIRGFLHDAHEAEDYYTAVYREPERARLRAPIVCLIGAQDRASELYEERYHEWEHFSDSVALAVIPGAGHYFLKHQAADVAWIVAETRAAQLRGPRPAIVAETRAAQLRGRRPAIAADSAAPARRAAGSAPNLLTFFLVAFGQFISLIGTGLTGFATGVWVYQRTGSVSSFALISVAALLPGILLAPIAGAVADRWDRRKLMMVADSFAAVGTVSLATLLWAGRLEIWHIYIIAAIGAVANAFQQPAYLAAITQLVPKRYYGRANGIVQLGGAAGTILAPLLGGLLVVAIGLHGIVLIDFATFLIAVTITGLVRFPDALFQKREEPFLREVARGWQYIARRHGLVMLIVFTVAINYLYSIMEVLTTPLALSLGSPAVLGVVAAATGAGLLVGSLAMGVFGGLRRRTDGIIGAVALFGLSTIAMGLRPSPVCLAIGLFGAGLSVALINAHWLSIVQTKVGLELQGRVMATNLMLVWSMMPLGFFTAGPLADWVFGPLLLPGGALVGSVGRVIGVGPGRGMALLLIVAGTLAMLLTAAAYAYRPIRRLEDELPDAIPGAVLAEDKDLLQRQADAQLQLATSAN